jgi:hypothetical protein
VWESRTGTAHFRGPGAPAKNAALYTVRAQHFPAFKPQSSEQRDLRYPPCSSCHAAEHGMRTRTTPTTPLSRKSASPAPSSRRHGTTRMHKATHEKRPPPRATRNQGTATLRAKRPQVSSMRLLSCGADDSRKHAGVRSPLQAPCACGTGSYIKWASNARTGQHESTPSTRTFHGPSTTTLRAERPMVSSAARPHMRARPLRCATPRTSALPSTSWKPPGCTPRAWLRRLRRHGMKTTTPQNTPAFSIEKRQVPAGLPVKRKQAPSTDRAPQHSEQRDQWYPLLLLPTCGHGHCDARHRRPRQRLTPTKSQLGNDPVRILRQRHMILMARTTHPDCFAYDTPARLLCWPSLKQRAPHRQGIRNAQSKETRGCPPCSSFLRPGCSD